MTAACRPPAPLDARGYALALGVSERTAKRRLEALEKARCPLVTRGARGAFRFAGDPASCACNCPGHAPPALDPARPYTPRELARALVERWKLPTHDRFAAYLKRRIGFALSHGTLRRAPGVHDRLVPLAVVRDVLEGLHPLTRSVVLRSIPEESPTEQDERRGSEQYAKEWRQENYVRRPPRERLPREQDFGWNDVVAARRELAPDLAPWDPDSPEWLAEFGTSPYECARWQPRTRAQGLERSRRRDELWNALCASREPFDPVANRPRELQNASRDRGAPLEGPAPAAPSTTRPCELQNAYRDRDAQRDASEGPDPTLAIVARVPSIAAEPARDLSRAFAGFEHPVRPRPRPAEVRQVGDLVVRVETHRVR